MKTLKTNFLKMFMIIPMILVLLSACAQQSGNAQVKSNVLPPEIDIQAAVISDNISVVKQHIEAGTDLNLKDPMSGSTPLITAAAFGKTEIAQSLIDAGADLSVKNNDGSTALHTASFFCHVEIVQALIDADADKSIRNNYGATARETVLVPFDQVKPIYEMIQQQMGPMGLKLDMAELEKTRPVIAMMLQ